MTARPERFQVGPHEYRIEWDSRLPIEGHDNGECAYLDRIVRIGQLLRPQQEPVTLMHEILHAVEDAVAVDLGETQVRALANGLAQALQSCGLYPMEFESVDYKIRLGEITHESSTIVGVVSSDGRVGGESDVPVAHARTDWTCFDTGCWCKNPKGTETDGTRT